MIRPFLLALALTLPMSGPVGPIASPVPVQVVADDGYSTPSPRIVGPSSPVGRGQLVVFSVAPFERPEGLAQYSYVWVVSPRASGALAWPDGSKVVFGSGVDGDPTRFDVVLVANYVFADKDGRNPTLKTVEVATTFDIGVGPKPPGPDPTPPGPDPKPPGPSPDLPAGKYNVSTFARDLGAKHPTPEANALGAVYKALASSPATSKAQLVNETVLAVRGSLGASLDAWRPDLDALAAKVNALNVVAVADCRVLYAEIALGLEAVK